MTTSVPLHSLPPAPLHLLITAIVVHLKPLDILCWLLWGSSTRIKAIKLINAMTDINVPVILIKLPVSPAGWPRGNYTDDFIIFN